MHSENRLEVSVQERQEWDMHCGRKMQLLLRTGRYVQLKQSVTTVRTYGALLRSDYKSESYLQ